MRIYKLDFKMFKIKVRQQIKNILFILSVYDRQQA